MRFCLVLAWLAAGAVLFANISPTFEKDESPFLSLSAEMKQFLDKHVVVSPIPKERLNLLVQAIFDRSLLDFEYSNNKTYTAAYYKLNNYTAAEKYLKKAGKLAKSSQQRNLYKRKLNYLYSHSRPNR